MTRVISSLGELGLVVRTVHTGDGRHVLVSVAPVGLDLIEAERWAGQQRLMKRLARLDADQRETLLTGADLMTAKADDSG